MNDAEIKAFVAALNLPQSAEGIFRRLREEEEDRKKNPALIELEAELKSPGSDLN